jgi:hypothetical protein
MIESTPRQPRQGLLYSSPFGKSHLVAPIETSSSARISHTIYCQLVSSVILLQSHNASPMSEARESPCGARETGLVVGDCEREWGAQPAQCRTGQQKNIPRCRVQNFDKSALRGKASRVGRKSKVLDTLDWVVEGTGWNSCVSLEFGPAWDVSRSNQTERSKEAVATIMLRCLEGGIAESPRPCLMRGESIPYLWMRI